MRDFLFCNNCIFNYLINIMRPLLLVLSLLFSFSYTFSQHNLNSIKSDKILVKNTFNKSYSSGSSKELQNAFGKAKKVIKERNDEFGGYDYTYKYNGLTVSFNNGWQATTITGQDYTVLFNKVAYKVGEHISKFKNQFSLSYQHRENLRKNQNALHIMIANADAYIYVQYNDS